MSPLIYYLAAFGAYTVSIILLTGQSFAWKETKRSFYLGDAKVGLFPTLATFCATWMSPLSLVGFGMWFYRSGYVAFWASVNGWMLGLLFFPFVVKRLRVARVASLPEWLEKRYGDVRVRKLVALTMIFLYVVYLVIQFRAFGIIVSYMLEIPQGFAATSLIYLFVLYTTFGGYLSVVRSDTLNLLLIVIGVSVAAWFSLPDGFSAAAARGVFRAESAAVSLKDFSLAEMFSASAMMFAWGLGVATNPQYLIRIIACRSRREAYQMLALSPYVVGGIYLCLTFFIMVCRLKYPALGNFEETMAFAKLGQFLPPVAGMLLLVCVIASAVSTANSQLLLAACSLCYDLLPMKKDENELRPFQEERFLFSNRIAITLIASAALILSHAGLPGYIRLGVISWTLVAIVYFYPLFTPRLIVKEILFAVLSIAIMLQLLLVFGFRLEPEYAMLVVLAGEYLVFAAARYARSKGCFAA
ncbi:MAG: sodium:solute symporter family protein [bacterium]|nr:sodium:solute symporter family protein [bacterium]